MGGLSQKSPSTLEDRFEMRHLQSSKESLEQEVQRLKSVPDSMKGRMADSKRDESGPIKKIEEQAEREMSLKSKLNGYERMEASGEEKVRQALRRARSTIRSSKGERGRNDNRSWGHIIAPEGRTNPPKSHQ